jgi:hypothetical protein
LDSNRTQQQTLTRRAFADASPTDASHPSPWAHFELAPPDPIIGLTEVCLRMHYLNF